jgi:hypothetical protein
VKVGPGAEPTAVARELAGLAGRVAHDAGRLAEGHVALLRSELRQNLGDVPGAVGRIGAGAGLVAIGGGLGVLALVHGLQKATRLPLWACHGLVGGTLAAAGIGLAARGRRQLATQTLLPRETLHALREDWTWLRQPFDNDTTTTTATEPNP